MESARWVEDFKPIADDAEDVSCRLVVQLYRHVVRGDTHHENPQRWALTLFLCPSCSPCHSTSKHSLWPTVAKQNMQKARCIALMLVPHLYRHHEKDLSVAIQGDDFVGEGVSHQADYKDKLPDTAIEIKRVGRIEAVADRQRRVLVLKQIVTRSAVAFTGEADPTLTVRPIELLGMGSAERTCTTSTKDIGNNDRCVFTKNCLMTKASAHKQQQD